MLQANVDLLGLTVSRSSSFRARVIVKNGLGDGGHVLSLAVADAVPSGDGLWMTSAAMRRRSQGLSSAVAVMGRAFRGHGSDGR